MKKIKQLSFFAFFALIFIYSSCSMDKRVYTSGYHIEWKNSVQNKDKQKLASNKNEKKIADDKILAVDQSKNEINTIGNNATTDNDISASVDNSVIHPLSKPVLWRNSVKKSITKTSINPTLSNNKNKKAKTNRNDDGDNQTLAIVGLVLGILGCIGYYAGPFFGLAAIIVSAIALNKIKKEPKEYGGKTMAIVGLILGIVAVVVWTIVIALIVASLALA